jgi:hypothetical protein
MQSNNRKKLVGAALMLAAITPSFAMSHVVPSHPRMVAALEKTYGFGAWTAAGFGLAGFATCSIATAGSGAAGPCEVGSIL